MNCAKCSLPVSSKGLCRKHYTAAWRAQRGDVYRKQQNAYAKKVRAGLSEAAKKKARKKHAAFQRDWRAQHATRLRGDERYGQRYLRRYGLTKEDYEIFFAHQKGACAICKKPSKKRLAVDHCHRSGRVRGLLCEPCNHGIGKFADDPIRCRAAAEYLEA